jgi:hypothetical protein
MIRITVAIALASIIAFVLWPHAQPNTAPAEVQAEAASAQSRASTVFQGNSWGSSPFALGAQHTATDQTEMIKQRRKVMTAGGYQTPERYFSMSVKELRQLASVGDVSAMLQLGERHWSESASADHDPELDVEGISRDVATRYFIRALQGGAAMVTTVMAKRTYGNGDIVEAAAWDRLARRYGQHQNNQAVDTARTFTGMSAQQSAAAESRAKQIAQQIGAPF